MTRRKRNIAERFLKKFSLLLVVFFISLVIGFAWWSQASGPVDASDKSKKIFVIPPGQETTLIISRLKEEGLIKNQLALKLLLLKERLWGKLQAGDFRLSPSMTAKELAYNLIEGRVDLWLVLPEGLRAEEVAHKAGEILGKPEDFQSAVAEFKNQEGHLFPDTYLVPREASPQEVINLLTQNFNNKTLSWQQQAVKLDSDLKEALILASLVEREAKFDEDRVIVAAILKKRLENDWPLQVDATLQYVKGNDHQWWPKVEGQDKELDSPYNTYLYQGLPPAPICNPGLESLEAVLQREETPYWFYISDEEGRMHYAENLEEHEANIGHYLNQ